MAVYYNEIDKKAAQWIRELIKDGLIPAGEVDERSIEDVKPSEVKGFEQCHFFAGIGGWAEALRLAGWGGRRIWTGSCPCQPFSVAGQKKGSKDRRHLWPAFFELIRACHPPVVIGEQVSAAIRHGWIDGVCSDLEKEGYSCGFHVLGAHSVLAPHIRQRLYWVAYAGCPDDGWPENPYDKPGAGAPSMPGGAGMLDRRHGRLENPERPDDRAQGEHNEVPRKDAARPSGGTSRPSSLGGLADGAGIGCQPETRAGNGQQPEEHREGAIGERGDPVGVGNSEGDDQRWNPVPGEHREGEQAGGPGSDVFWKSVWHPCQDGKTRRIPASVASEPIFQRMADGVPGRVDEMRPESGFPVCSKVEGRVLLLKGYGNAIVPPLAAEFVKCFMEVASNPVVSSGGAVRSLNRQEREHDPNERVGDI